MLHIVTELPEHVELSPKLRERTPFYICVTLFGVAYYIPATKPIRQLLELDAKGRHSHRDRRLRWGDFQKADALRDIVAALSLQVRDVELAGIQEGVEQTVLKKMREIMAPKLREMIEQHAPERLMLPEKTDSLNCSENS